MKHLYLIILSTLLTSCSYKMANTSLHSTNKTVHISPIEGDHSGILTQSVASEIARYTPLVISNNSKARYQLDISITDKESKHIGYRFDIEDPNEPTDDRTVPVESRRIILARVQMYDNYCDQCLLGPDYLRVSIDYDHDHNLTDASRQSLSMGQLTSYSNSQDFVDEPLGKELANAITLYLNQNL